MTTKAQQIAMDNALVAPENQRVIDKCNMRINPGMKPKEPTYQVVLDALALILHSLSLLKFQSSTCISSGLPSTNTMHHIDSRSITKEIKYITDVIVDHMYQPWRTFASIINKCLCGKVFGLDKIRLSRVQILWGMYYKKNLDFVASIWEDLAYQIDNKDSKKQDRILLGTMRFISRHEDTQVYGAILPKVMTNQAMLDSVAYKTYYAIASGAEPPKSKKSQKKSDSAILSEESPSKKKPASKPKPTKKKAPVKADKGKTDGTDFELRFPDEQQRRTSGTDEGTDDDDEDDIEGEIDNDGNDDDDGDNDDNDDDSDDERTESERDAIPNLNQSNKKRQKKKKM
ncbi:retrovirus-related pol polyprotein from transposon TNT 1-94 [Tanacetum coccineum]